MKACGQTAKPTGVTPMLCFAFPQKLFGNRINFQSLTTTDDGVCGLTPKKLHGHSLSSICPTVPAFIHKHVTVQSVVLQIYWPHQTSDGSSFTGINIPPYFHMEPCCGADEQYFLVTQCVQLSWRRKQFVYQASLTWESMRTPIIAGAPGGR